jgi:epoxyqueuosine reductase QueG
MSVTININEHIRNVAEQAGVNYYGVADLTLAHDYIREQFGEAAASYPRGIVFGIAMPHALVNLLPRRTETPGYAVMYRHHSYTVINERLDLLSSRLFGVLQQEGHQVLPVTASDKFNPQQAIAFFSHKLAAHLAGLGWIGKSCMLITPQAGPRVRWATVLTDAPLAPTGTPLAERCGTCHQCVDICPAKAYTGRNFREDEPREARYDAFACREVLQGANAELGVPVCGMCVYICPHGRKTGNEC